MPAFAGMTAEKFGIATKGENAPAHFEPKYVSHGGTSPRRSAQRSHPVPGIPPSQVVFCNYLQFRAIML
jgi:hypothetical protein